MVRYDAATTQSMLENPQLIRVVDLLSGLPSDDRDSLPACPAWSVKHVALHLLAATSGGSGRGVPTS